jgi:hypothetical protein
LVFTPSVNVTDVVSRLIVLVDDISPPPLKPLPAVIDTAVWSICLFATYPVVESCDICDEPETNEVPVATNVPVTDVFEPNVINVPVSVMFESPICSELKNQNFVAPLIKPMMLLACPILLGEQIPIGH